MELTSEYEREKHGYFYWPAEYFKNVRRLVQANFSSSSGRNPSPRPGLKPKTHVDVVVCSELLAPQRMGFIVWICEISRL